MPICENAIVIQNKEISRNVFHLIVNSPQISKIVVPGQFLNIQCSTGLDAFLRRPISVFFAQGDLLEIVFQVKGSGTSLLAKFPIGSSISLVGPLGKGFDTTITNSKIAVVGGGIGIFPLYYLLTELKNCEKYSFIGFRSKENVIFEKEFSKESDVFSLSTDDGSYGQKGLVIKPLEDRLKLGLDQVYTCGPLPMIENVIKLCNQYNVKCQVSLEQRMCCGIGACAVCVCKAKSNNEDKWEYLRVCKNGPIFDSNQIIFD